MKTNKKSQTETIGTKKIVFGVILIGLGLFGAFTILNSLKNEFAPNLGMMGVYPPSVSSMGIAESAPDMMSEGYDGIVTNRLMKSDLVETSSSIPRQKIDTASLSLLVDNVSDSITTIKDIASSAEGYVGNSNIYETGNDMIQGSITIRIPSTSFETTLEQIKNIAVKVENESTNGEDVTEQLIDVNSRITNLKNLEEQYRKILKSATKTDDILRVTNEINNVRQQIESMESQLKYLDQAVAMSTITVQLKAIADVQVLGLTWKPLLILKQALRNMVDGILDYVEKIIYLAFYLPVIAIWIATVGAIILGGYKVVLIILNKTVKGKKK